MSNDNAASGQRDDDVPDGTRAATVEPPAAESGAAASTPTRRWRVGHAEVGSTAGVISTLLGLLQFRVDRSALAMALMLLMVAGTAAAMWALVASPSRIRTNAGWRLVLAITVLVGGSATVLTAVRFVTAADRTVLSGHGGSGSPGPSASQSPPAPPGQATSPGRTTSCVDEPAASPVTGREADPRTPARRRAERTLAPYEALDLDSLDPDWKCTTGAWDGHDVSYRTDNPGTRLEYRRDRKAAALPVDVPHTSAACTGAPYDDPAAAPRADVVRPPRAICVTTSEGRQALIEILDLQRAVLTVRITVWEKAR